MEVELHDHGVDKSSRNREESKISEKKAKDDHVVININDDDDDGRSRNSEEGSNVCRICLESAGNVESHQLIQLGCDCRGGLALSHHNCAAAWFSHKGNTVCEICGKMAKNMSSKCPAEASSSIEMMIVTQLRSEEASRERGEREREEQQQLQVGTFVRCLPGGIVVFVVIFFLFLFIIRSLFQ